MPKVHQTTSGLNPPDSVTFLTARRNHVPCTPPWTSMRDAVITRLSGNGRGGADTTGASEPHSIIAGPPGLSGEDGQWPGPSLRDEPVNSATSCPKAESSQANRQARVPAMWGTLGWVGLTTRIFKLY